MSKTRTSPIPPPPASPAGSRDPFLSVRLGLDGQSLTVALSSGKLINLKATEAGMLELIRLCQVNLNEFFAPRAKPGSATPPAFDLAYPEASPRRIPAARSAAKHFKKLTLDDLEF